MAGLENSYGEYYNPSGLFLKRSGELLEIPEIATVELSPQEIEGVLEYEHELYNLTVDDESTVGSALELNDSFDVNAIRFCNEYFKADPGVLADLSAKNGINPPSNTDDETLNAWFSGVSIALPGSQELRVLSKESIDFVKESLVEPIMTGEIDGLEDFARHETIILNPEEFVAKLELVAQARRQIFQIWRAKRIELKDLQQNPTTSSREVLMAELAVVDIYLAKINAKLAGLYAMTAYLSDQIDATDQQENSRLLGERLGSVVPRGVLNNMANKDRRFGSQRRLDALRNGLYVPSKGDESQKSSSITPMLYNEFEQSAETTEPRFTKEEIAKLKSFMLTPEQMEAAVRLVLEKTQYLSDSTEPYTAGQTSFASDGKWRTAVSPLKDTFAVERSARTFLVAKNDRSLYDLIVVAAAHEMRHVEQEEVAIALAGKLAIARVGGKRVEALTEGDANAVQIVAEQEIFGESKQSIRTTFASALAVLEKDPSAMVEAARAFYQTLESYGNSGRAKAIEAIDRVFRLTRYGKDSMPLSYAEGGLMAKTSGFSVSGAPITTFDLPDQHRLHRFGLLPDDISIKNFKWYEIMLDVVEPYIDQALRSE